MYLSKNSRYVLQKAQFLSPFEFLKGVEKNLSVKTPKDDPAKPALRVNIPEERPRSKSVGAITKPTPIKAGFEERFLPAENEIQFSKFSVDDILVESNLNSKQKSGSPRLSGQDAGTSRCVDQNDYNDGLETVLHEATTEEALGNSFFGATMEKPKSSADTEQKEPLTVVEGDIDPKTLYIIIDVPEKRDDKSARLSSADLIKEKNSTLFQEKNCSFVRGMNQNLERKSKSLPRFSTFKQMTPGHVSSCFEVHELDDASTYVFHLKFNRSHRGVVCVPERDITTRHGEDKTAEGPINVKVTTGSKHPMRKQVTIIEERPEPVRYGNDGKSPKTCRSEDGIELPIHFEEVGVAELDGVGQPQPEEQVKVNRDKVGFNVFVRDDFGAITNGIKANPYKIPTSKGDKKREGETVQEDSIGSSEHSENPITTDWWTNDPVEETKMSTLANTSSKSSEKAEPGTNKLPPQQKPQLPQPSKKPEPSSPYFNISDVITDRPVEEALRDRNLSDNMFNIKELFNSEEEGEIDPSQSKKDKINPQYFNIEEVIPERKRGGMRSISDKKSKLKHKKIQKNQQHKFRRLSPEGEIKATEKEGIDFHTCSRCLSIACESNNSGFMNFGSAFPPLLSEALKTRFKFRKEFLLPDKWNNIEAGLKGRNQKGCSIEENSILFPDKEHGNLNCENLFMDKDEIVSNLIQNSEKQTAKPDREAPAASPSLSVDSLTLMKKVKEIVQFDLNNAVKIFTDDGGCPRREQSSVVMFKDDGEWEVNTNELEKHVERRKSEMMLDRGRIWCKDVKEEHVKMRKDETKLEVRIPSSENNPEKHVELKKSEVKLQVSIGDQSDAEKHVEVKKSEVTLEAAGTVPQTPPEVVKPNEPKREVEISPPESTKEVKKEDVKLEAEVQSSVHDKEGPPETKKEEKKLDLETPSPDKKEKEAEVKKDEVKLEKSGPSPKKPNEGSDGPKKGDGKLEPESPSPANLSAITKEIAESSAGGECRLPLYLPPKAENPTEMKLEEDYSNSVVMFDSITNKFFIQQDALEKAIKERTNDDTVDELFSALMNLAEDNVMSAKKGDSILVYDVETKSWKVDFSILEKRQQQLQLEEELTKRSEAILETFERFEKEQLSAVPKPDSPEKKTFDYEKEEWKAYNPGKKNLSKTKLPFKKSNAEEIRKKNSDMYENLFDGKKKTPTTTTTTTTTEENKPKDTTKQTKLCGSKQTDPPGPTPMKGPPTPPPAAKSDSKIPIGKDKARKEDDHFWETFLKIQVPPKPSKEPFRPPVTQGPLLEPTGIQPLKIPPTPPPPPTSTSTPTPQPQEQPPLPTTPKIPKSEPLKQELPKKKIEEPRFRIHLPFIKDKKIEKPLPSDKKVEEKKPPTPPTPPPTPPTPPTPPPVSAPPPKEEPLDKAKPPPPPPSNVKIEKKEEQEPKVKAPPPSSTVTPKGDPPVGVPKKPPPTIGSPPKQSSPPAAPNGKMQEQKVSPPKNDKNANPSDHYVSDKIIEISRTKTADPPTKIKTNKIETVKLNITADTRMPSKITEINLNNKKSEEKPKDQSPPKKSPVEASTPKSKIPVTPTSSLKGDGKKLKRHLETFKTPFAEPDFEEKFMKIKPDLESNPNLKKLDNWSKTLVLHDIMKPPENLETWLKDETDKMATLLLKVLQEAGDAKTKKKQPKVKDKHLAKPTFNDRKKQKNVPDNFFLRVQTMNLGLGNEKNSKLDEAKFSGKPESVFEKPGKQSNPVKASHMAPDVDSVLEYGKNKRGQLTTAFDNSLAKDFSQPFSLEITDDIPGPEILKKIANTWRKVPILGSQLTISSMHRIHQLVNLGASILGGAKFDGTRRNAFAKLFSRYGPVVNVQGPLSGNVILLHKAEHLNAVFEQDAPLRSIFDSLEQSRRDVEEKYSPTAISTDWNKSEWNELRRGTNDPLLKGWDMFFGSTKAAAESLVYVVRRNRNGQNLVSDDFMHEIKRWSLEGLCNVLFEKSFGYLEGRVSSDNWILEPEKLYMAVDDATTYLNKCEKGFQSWRLFTTPSLAGLADSYRSISSVITKQLNQAEINLKNKNAVLRKGSFMANMDLTFVESMLLNDGMTPDEIICNLTDTVIIGANVMNSAFAFLLYNLAQNGHAQKKLFGELKEVLPSKNTQLDFYKLSSLKYLQACLRESLRLHPPVPVFYRLLQNDILVSNYIIPKGTYVVMDCGQSNMKEHIFEEPNRFLPERWLDEDRFLLTYHPFASFPLCHGPRSELVKRVVEMQLSAGIAKIIRNFGIEYNYEDIQGTDTLISFPDKPLKFNFIERES